MMNQFASVTVTSHVTPVGREVGLHHVRTQLDVDCLGPCDTLKHVSDAENDVTPPHVSLMTRVLQVEGNFYVNDSLEKLMFEELRNACRGGGVLLFTTSALRSSSPAHSVLLLISRCGRIPASHETNRERGGAAGDRPRQYHVAL